MNKRLSAAIAALGLVATAIAAPAAAQSPERRLPWSDVPQSRSQPALHAFAACVAGSETRRARAVLAMDYRTPAYDRALEQLLQRNVFCLEHSRAGSSHRFFAGRIAEALLLRDIRGSDLGRHVARDPARPPIQARDETELMAFCTVRAAPGPVADLFATRPAGPEEAAAIQALTPQIGSCLAAGATGQFNRAALRSILGLAAYRLSQHNGAARTARVGAANLDGTIR